MAESGYAVTVPDLASAVAAGPPYHRRQAELIAESAAGQPAILIGYSRAGPLLAAAGTILAEGLRGYVFVDARMPAPGRSWMETVQPEFAARLRGMADPQGWLPPWPQWWSDADLAEILPDQSARQQFAAGCPRLPLAMLEERYPAAPGWPGAPGGYLQLSEAYGSDAARAGKLGWPVRQQLSHHLALLTEPGRVASAVLSLVRQALGSADCHGC
ncbi:MAG TPA: hypothetical protein VGI64_00955 [Streptosporangiaceae bacterium]